VPTHAPLAAHHERSIEATAVADPAGSQTGTSTAHQVGGVTGALEPERRLVTEADALVQPRPSVGRYGVVQHLL
jgi:hypothetical protein